MSETVILVVVGAVLGFVGSWLAQWPARPGLVWHRLRAAKRRERSCYAIPRGLLYIIPSANWAGGEGLERSIYWSAHDWAAVRWTTKMLQEFDRKEGTDYHVYLQNPDEDIVPSVIRTENLLLVCGPKRNQMVKTILDRWPDILAPLHFNAPEIAFEWNTQTFKATPMTDWAVVAIKENPYNPRRRLVLLFGLNAVGTEGAGEFLSSTGLADMRLKAAEKFETVGGDISILLRVEHRGNAITSIQPLL